MIRIARFAAAFLALAATLAAPGAGARVTRLELVTDTVFGTFAGAPFRRIDGRVIGELSPDEPIPGLARAPRNARGRVEYRLPFSIVMPASADAGNGTLLVDVPNRGRPISHFLYNGPREPLLPLALEPGNGFLQRRGYTVAMLQWELGQGTALPEFVDDAGVTRAVEGAGPAAIRDFAAYLRFAPATEGNPLAGRLQRTLAVGYSQTARLLKTFLIEGFNRTDDGRAAFDGMHVHAAASGVANVMANASGRESSTFFTPRFSHPEFRGVTEEPLAWRDIVARASARGAPLPRLVVTNATTDYWSIHASLARTGAGGTSDLPLPDGVRVYDIAGASHGRSAKRNCTYPPGVLDFTPVMRASLVILDEWVRGRAPPASRLMPLEPRPGEPTLLQAPAHLPGAIVQVPRTDADGNALGGVRLPDVAVPLGTHGAQNLPLADRSCNLDAAYLAFARTRAERAPGDARVPLDERYGGRDDYVARVRTAAQALVSERFMPPEDAIDATRAAERVALP